MTLIKLSQKLALVAILLLGALNSYSQVKIGDNPTIKDPNSVLELESTKMGFRLPRLALTSTTSFAPLTAHVVGMKVYNTATVGDVTPGIYYNDGSKWNRVASQSDGKDLTGDGILIVGGTATTLKATSLTLDSTVVARQVSKSPVSDSVKSVVKNAGKDYTSTSSPLVVTGGTKSTLVDVSIQLDSTKLGSWLTKSPMNDSLAVGITKSPAKDSVLSIVNKAGKDYTSTSSPLIITGGAKSTLVGVSINLDSTKLGSWLTKSPMNDSLAVGITISPAKDSVLSIVNKAGKDYTSTSSPLIITGGAKSTLVGVSINLDSTKLGSWLTKSPMNDSLAVGITKSPAKDSVLSIVNKAGKDYTSTSSPLIITGGAKSTLVGVSINLDSTKLGSWLNKSPMKDSLATALATSPAKDSILSFVNKAGKDLTGDGIIVTGGTATTLKATSLKLDSSVVAKIIAKSPASDSVLSVVSKAGKDYTSTSSPLIITGGAKSTLVGVSINLDSTKLGSWLTKSPMNDSLAVGITKSPAKDSVLSIVNKAGKDYTSTSSPLIITGGAKSTLVGVSINLDSTKLGSWLNKSPMKDSLATALATSPAKDSILSFVNKAGKDLTGDGIIVTGGTATTLKATSLKLDSSVVAKIIAKSPASDSVLSVVSKAGKDYTSTSSPLIITGGAKSTLVGVSINLDSTKLGSWLNKSPMKDSLATALATSPAKDSILSFVNKAGKDLTGDGIIVTGGTATTLKATSLKLDSSVVAKIIAKSPASDSVLSVVSKAGKDYTSTSSPLIITGGAKSTLVGVSINLDSTKLGSWLNKSPMKDSLATALATSPAKDSILSFVNKAGKDLTGDGIIVTGGTATTLKATSLKLDSSVVAKIIAKSPASDSVLSVVSKAGKDYTSTSSPLIITGGAKSTLVGVSINLDSTKLGSWLNKSPMKDSLATALATSPAKDSILSFVNKAGKDYTSTSSPLIITGGAKSTLVGVSINLDSTKLGSWLNKSPMKDSLATALATSPAKDSILSFVNKAGKDYTSTSSPLIITGGAKSTLVGVSINLDSTKLGSWLNKSPMKDSLATALATSPAKDSILSFVNKAGKDYTSTSSPLIITGGAKSTLVGVSINLDSTKLGSWLTKSPMNDSLAVGITKSPAKDSVLSIVNKAGKDYTSTSSPLIITGGAKSTLVGVSINLDSTKLGSWLNKSPMKDSLATALATSPAKDSILSFVNKAGKDYTSTSSPLIITGGAKSTLVGVSINLDSTKLGSWLNKSPMKDSLATALATSPAKDSILSFVNKAGKDLTGDGIIVTGGTATTLKATSLRLDSTVIAKFITKNPVKDSIATLIKEPWYSTTTNKGATKNTDSVYILGNVGIGTDTPRNTLVVKSATAGTSGVTLTNLTQSSGAVTASKANGKYLTVDSTGKVVLANTVDPIVDVSGLAAGLLSPVAKLTFEGGTFAPDVKADPSVIYSNLADGTTWIYDPVINKYKSYTPPAATEWYLSGTTTDAGASKAANIGRTGRVGIGTTTPTNMLHVKDTANPIRLEGLKTALTSDHMLMVGSDGVVRKFDPSTKFIADSSQTAVKSQTPSATVYDVIVSLTVTLPRDGQYIIIGKGYFAGGPATDNTKGSGVQGSFHLTVDGTIYDETYLAATGVTTFWGLGTQGTIVKVISLNAGTHVMQLKGRMWFGHNCTNATWGINTPVYGNSNGVNAGFSKISIIEN